jgi:23S rRNA A1618 N6-methylase RlmF
VRNFYRSRNRLNITRFEKIYCHLPFSASLENAPNYHEQKRGNFAGEFSTLQEAQIAKNTLERVHVFQEGTPYNWFRQ